jgi:phosphoglycolate phosphatase
MSRKYDLIVFDWDGTLADSTSIIIQSIRRAAEEAGLPVPGKQAASSIIGLGLREAIFRLFGELAPAQLDHLIARYAHHYHAQENDIPLFEGAYDAVAALAGKGYLLGVATGKGRNGLNRALEQSGLKPHIHGTRCVDECHSKPHPQMLLELMDEFAVRSERTLMIGDTSFDLQMAQNANVASLGVTYGAHPVEHLLPHAPLAHFDEFAKVNQWLIMNA